MKMIIKCLFVCMIFTVSATASIMPAIEVDSSLYSIADFNSASTGDELRIDYYIRNISEFTDPANAFKNIEINAGINQGIYDAAVPFGWEAIYYDNKTRFHTADSAYYIYPDQSEPVKFSLFYLNTDLTIGLSQAMTPFGIWTDTVLVKTGTAPEPATIMLFSMAMLYIRKKQT